MIYQVNPFELGTTREQISKDIKVTCKTVDRWKHKGTDYKTHLLLKIVYLGEMPWPEWQNWKIENGKITDQQTKKCSFDPTDLRYHYHCKRQLAELKELQKHPYQYTFPFETKKYEI